MQDPSPALILLHRDTHIMFVITATFFSLCALITGILVVGSGVHFQYEPVDFIRGKVNAWLYLWVILSSIFSLAHFMVLLNYGLTWHWTYRLPETHVWMILHTGVGFLFTTAHAFVRRYLKQGHGEQYMWGPLRAD